MSFTPSIIPAKRRVQRKRNTTPPPPPTPPAQVLVVAVTTMDNSTADVQFNVPVTVTGAGPVGFYVDMGELGWQFALESTQIAPNVVRYSYQDSGVFVGTAWEILAVLENLDLGGLTMPVPQSGLISAVPMP